MEMSVSQSISVYLYSVLVQVQPVCQLLPQLDSWITVHLKNCLHHIHLRETDARYQNQASAHPELRLLQNGEALLWLTTWLLVKAVRGLRPMYQFIIGLLLFSCWRLWLRCWSCCGGIHLLLLLFSFSGEISKLKKKYKEETTVLLNETWRQTWKLFIVLSF